MWAEGQKYYDRSEDGYVETWMGICHGWAPASYMVARPEKAITVTAADGINQIKFFPADLKALASLLWAKARFQKTFIGGRCNSKDPQTDSDDRLIDQKCLDNNPASFHLSLINAIGIIQKVLSWILHLTLKFGTSLSINTLFNILIQIIDPAEAA